MQAMQNHHISRQFSRLNDSALSEFAGEVITSMTGNPNFPNPLVPLAELSALRSDFVQKQAESEMGGRVATVNKNNARALLLDALRRQAGDIQSAAGQDLAGLLSSGFQAASANRTPTPLAVPVILAIVNEASTQLRLRLTPVPNARAYQVQVRNGDGEWKDGGVYPQARRLVVENLTPGSVYAIQVRAVGGSTGYSHWSDPVSRMSM